MNAKTVFSTALVWTVVGLGAVRGQGPGPSGISGPPGPSGPYGTSNTSSTMLPPPGASGGSVELVPAAPGQYSLSSWIRGDKYGCCDLIGGNGPIQTELFFRGGPSLSFGGGQVARSLDTGLYLGAGGRALFFDPSMQSAWTVELGLANIRNHSSGSPPMALEIFVPQNPAKPATLPDSTGVLPPQRVFFGKGGIPGVTLQELNRTYLDLGVGKEWYLWGSANCDGPKWRVGFDGGGRWGSERAGFREIPHRSDTLGGLWAAAHSDFEYPLSGCCIFQAGFRVEYGYTWSDIMQIQNNSDVQDVNLLFSVGIRF